VSEGRGDGFEEVEVGELSLNAVIGAQGFDGVEVTLLEPVGGTDGGGPELTTERLNDVRIRREHDRPPGHGLNPLVGR
jgi:hypothetical protein